MHRATMQSTTGAHVCHELAKRAKDTRIWRWSFVATVILAGTASVAYGQAADPIATIAAAGAGGSYVDGGVAVAPWAAVAGLGWRALSSLEALLRLAEKAVDEAVALSRQSSTPLASLVGSMAKFVDAVEAATGAASGEGLRIVLESRPPKD